MSDNLKACSSSWAVWNPASLPMPDNDYSPNEVSVHS